MGRCPQECLQYKHYLNLQTQVIRQDDRAFHVACIEEFFFFEFSSFKPEYIWVQLPDFKKAQPDQGCHSLAPRGQSAQKWPFGTFFGPWPIGCGPLAHWQYFWPILLKSGPLATLGKFRVFNRSARKDIAVVDDSAPLVDQDNEVWDNTQPWGRSCSGGQIRCMTSLHLTLVHCT